MSQHAADLVFEPAMKRPKSGKSLTSSVTFSQKTSKGKKKLYKLNFTYVRLIKKMLEKLMNLDFRSPLKTVSLCIPFLKLPKL